MRFTRLTLNNYLRIYNGLQIHKLDIDLTKAQNKIIMIHGGNGRGKTTIENALTFCPEPPSEMLPNLAAGKYIAAVAGNDFYEGDIIYPVNGNGNRMPTKASFKKNGVELNPNGNITSYNEIIATEFRLDPNFLALSFLSFNDRGLADKSPAERRKYISYALSAVDTYITMNKSFSKKSNILNSHIKALVAKMNVLGKEEDLELQYESLGRRIKQLEISEMDLEKGITSFETKISLLDPDGEIQKKYVTIVEEVSRVQKQVEERTKELEKFLSMYDIEDNLAKAYASVEKLLDDNIILQSTSFEQIKMLEENLLDIEADIDVDTAKRMSMESEHNTADIAATIIQYSTLIEEQEDAFTKMGIRDFNVTKEEILSNIESIRSIKEAISRVKSVYHVDSIQTVAKDWDYYNNSNYESISSSIRTIESKISELEARQSYFKGLYNRTVLLEKRSSKCKVDDCLFIKDGLEALKENPAQNIEELEVSLSELKADLVTTLNVFENFKDGLEIKGRITDAIDIINENKISLSKFNNTKNILSKKVFLSKLAEGYGFRELDDVSIYMNYMDIIKNYNSNVSTLKALQDKWATMNDNGIQILVESIEKNQKKKQDTVGKMRLIQSNINNRMQTIEDLKQKRDRINTVIEINKTLEECQGTRDSLKLEYSQIKDKIKQIDEHFTTITNFKNSLFQLRGELDPLKAQFDEIAFNRKLLVDYKVEYNYYAEKYNKIVMLKKFSSPNGIQTEFMNIYMGDTLETTNNLLSFFFNGEIQILKPVINENEFRIPCIVEGLARDDISSCSNAQISMISMILSFAMITQSSDIYNIIRLDEVDSSLDWANRMEFRRAILKLIEMLNIEQLFIVSHSTEVMGMDLDYICLSRTDDIYGNIIYAA